MKKLLFVVLLLLFLTGGGFALIKARLNPDDSEDYAYRVDRIVVEHIEGEETIFSYYATLNDAFSKTEEGDVIRLFSDIDIGTETIVIDKPITIDGNGYSMTANVNKVDLFKVTSDFTLQNLKLTYAGGQNAKKSYSVINAIGNGVNIKVIDCAISTDSRFVTVEGSSEYNVGCNLNIKDSSIVGGNCVIYTYYANPDITITNSVVLGKSSYKDVYWTTVLIEGGCKSINITDGSVVSGRSRGLSLWKDYGIVYIGRDSVIGNGWEGLSTYGITPDNTYAIEVYGRGYNEYNIILDHNALLTSTGENEIYYREDGKVSNVYFGENYSGLVATSERLPGENSNNYYKFHNSLADAVANGYENIIIPHKELTLTEPIWIEKVKRIFGACIVSDLNLTPSAIVPVIRYNGSDPVFGMGAAASLTVKGIKVVANKIFEELNEEHTFITYDKELADQVMNEGYSLTFDSGNGYYVSYKLVDQTALAGAYLKDTNFTEQDCTWEDMVESYELYQDSEVPYYSEQSKELCALSYDIIVPNDVTHIEFFDVNSIIFPETTTKIGYVYTFCGSIFIRSTTPPELLGSLQGEMMDTPPPIYVPIGCGEIYRTAEGWSVYADYIFESVMPI